MCQFSIFIGMCLFVSIIWFDKILISLFIIALLSVDYFCDICIMISWWYIRPSYISIISLKKHQLISYCTWPLDKNISFRTSCSCLLFYVWEFLHFILMVQFWKCHSWLKICLPVVKYKFTWCTLVYLYLFNVESCVLSFNFIGVFLSVLECDWWMFNLNVHLYIIRWYFLLTSKYADIFFSLQNNTTTNASKMKTIK